MKGNRFLILWVILWLGGWLILLSAMEGMAQVTKETKLSNWRIQTLVAPSVGDTIVLDSLSVVPETVEIKAFPRQELQAGADYILEEANAHLIWQKADVDSVRVSYRVLPFYLPQRYFRKDLEEVRRFVNMPKGYEYYIKKQNREDLFNRKGLDYSGTFGRGISFGNRQDLVVNSNFNLEMAGKLANDVEILAAISDNNIPFQPEGNTQQLQEFDRIFIQLKKDQHRLLMGDYELPSPKGSYFNRFFRKLQGAQLETSSDFGANKWQMLASGAIAKGNYNRMVFDGLEGNQGPYRLAGSNGELFIIVLSNTERVFIDGKQLTRGADQDYVIDYNTAEVTFTANQLITKDKRIVIEFEYSDRNYLRSMYQVHSSFGNEKWQLEASIFSEQDAKNQPLISGEISAEQLNALQLAGDDRTKAVIPSGIPTEYNPSINLYRLVADTSIAGIMYDSLYVLSANPNEQLYSVQFSDVGQGNGDYVISTSTINQRIFEFVPRDSLTGLATGKYLPISQLITPLKRQLITVGGKWDISPNTKFRTELAMSNRDANTFSDIDDGDDRGMAAFTELSHTFLLNPTKKSKINTSASYEWRQDRFIPIESYRSIEFNRNWNISQANERFHEQVIGTSIAWEQGSFSKLGYTLNAFLQQSNYQGLKHQWNSFYRKNNWRILVNGSYLQSTYTDGQRAHFLRPRYEIARSMPKWKGWTFGSRGELERNRRLVATSDSLSLQSFYYHQVEGFIQTPDSLATQLGLEVKRRTDLAPVGSAFQNATVANMIGLKGAFTKNPKHTFRWNLNYRNLRIIAPSLTQETGNIALLGEIDHLLVIKKGFVRSSLNYQLGSGQVQKKEYVYQEVPAGTGNYLWIDDDEEGEEGFGIQELEEFVLANANNQVQANFVRIILPTNEFEKTNQSRINWSVNITPKTLWLDKGGIRQFLSRFATRSRLSASRQVQADTTRASDFVPFAFGEDTLSISQTLNHLSTLFYNRNNPKFSMTAYLQHIFNKNFLLSGTDERRKQEQGWTLRYVLQKQLVFDFKNAFGSLDNISKAFVNRDYTINYWLAEPALSLQWKNKWRFSTSYQLKQSKNDYWIDGDLREAQSQQHRFDLETRYGSPIKRSVDARASLVFISVSPSDFDLNAASAYAMLEGLRPGRNLLWTVNYRTRLSGNIELTLTYDGRQSGDGPVNHTGRAGVRAFF